MNRKRFFLIVLFFMCCNVSNVIANMEVYERPGVSVVVENQPLNLSNIPIIVNNRTLIPLRELVVGLGVPDSEDFIIWNAENRSVRINYNNTNIDLFIDGTYGYVNGNKVLLDSAPIIYRNRTYLPAKFVAEALGYNVEWEPYTLKVLITKQSVNSEIKNDAQIGVLDTTYSATPIARVGQSARAYYSDGLIGVHYYGGGIDEWLDERGNVVIPNSSGYEFINGIAVTYNGKYGCINKQGKEVIEHKYDRLENFGKFFVAEDSGKYYVLNLKGERIETNGFDGIKVFYINRDTKKLTNTGDLSYIDVFHSDLCLYGIAFTNSEKVTAFIDINSNELIILKDEYDKVEPLDKYLKISKDDKFGVVDLRGNVVVNPKYDEIELFKDGRAKVQTGRYVGYIDENGKEVIACNKYIEGTDFYKGYAYVKKSMEIEENSRFSGEWLRINKKGEEFNLTDTYYQIDNFSEGLVAVIKKSTPSKYFLGYLNEKGETIIDFKFELGTNAIHANKSFIDGIAYVYDTTEMGYFINKFGEKEFDFSEQLIYDYELNNGLIKSGQVCISKQGKFYQESDSYWNDDLRRVMNGENKYGFINTEGYEIIKCKYDWAGGFYDGISFVKKDGKYGYIDKVGNEVVPCIYDKAENFSDGVGLVYKDGLLYLIKLL